VLPSEIRTLQAVDAREKLGHLVNVVVFSSKPSAPGAKPVFALMGGGDLDGDTYWACWDPELTHQVKQIDVESIKPGLTQNVVSVEKENITKSICSLLC